MTNNDYVLGDSDEELRRLSLQSRLLEPATRRFLTEVGVGGGCSLLDIGTGRGDLAVMAAEMSDGSAVIVGIDSSAPAIEAAKARVERDHLNVAFETVDIDDLEVDRKFDFVVARYVLAHQRDEVGFIRRAAAHVRPGGTLAFLDVDTEDNRSIYAVPPIPLLDEVTAAIWKVFASMETRMNPGSRYHQLFFEAGLPEPTVMWEHLRPTGNADIVDWLCGIVKTIEPALARLDPALVANLNLDTLQERLLQALSENHSQVSPARLAGGWVVIA